MRPLASSKTRPCAAIGLIDCLMYISLLMILLGLAFAAFYRTIEQATHLNQNTSDLVRALWAGERWRGGYRPATASPRFVEEDNLHTLVLRLAEREVVYRFTNNVVMREDSSGVSEELVTGVKASTFHRDARQHVTAWRWELALQPQRRVVRVLPLLSFQAVAAKASP